MLNRLYGMQADLEAKLKLQGIKDSEDLVRVCRTAAGLEGLANVTGIDPLLLARLAHRAELSHIRGIGEAYIVLLEQSGVHTTYDLAQANPEDLRARFASINAERRLVGRVPALAMVNGWVHKARRLAQPAE